MSDSKLRNPPAGDGDSSSRLSRRSRAGFFSSAKSFFLPHGQFIEPGLPRGYYVDFAVKAHQPTWPTAWRLHPDRQLYVWIIQHGLGSFERYLAGDGQVWLDSALQTGRHLVGAQERGGKLVGAWFHRAAYPHTYRLRPPWVSAMAQGQGASLLARLYVETGEEQFAEAALRALGPLRVSAEEGGTMAYLRSRPFPEEYPTTPGSFVLNGALFTAWGAFDVEAALPGASVGMWQEYVTLIVKSLYLWDLGYWSRYDLYPHPVENPASSFYHILHVSQLKETGKLSGEPAFAEVAARWERFAGDRAMRRKAFARKALFRLLVPRNRVLAHRLPLPRGRRRLAADLKSAST